MRNQAAYSGSWAEDSVENFKRRRALSPLSWLEAHSRFFDRLVQRQKTREVIFISKNDAKHR
ncbi:MAG: hypothetical protein HYZ52_03260 [Candidatus Omnitrophica bacterium]|nr:hypothetical protein [Candidatus Omnitrophota bacterium]